MRIGYFSAAALNGDGGLEVGSILRSQFFACYRYVVNADLFRQHVGGKIHVS